jgi:hypothetical protein
MDGKIRRDGASGENRTPTPVKIIDFESIASTSSATEALYVEVQGNIANKGECQQW